ncbi:hypothetical protein DOY81_001410 [Sarcophaga bullata]|nr:hypothetical protein DOY81_001410 [Sarcophaga bullata]
MLLFLTLLTALVSQVSLQNSVSISSRVMGGDFAEKGKYPYHVALLQLGGYLCGGSIISKTFILTAAHCLYGTEPSKIQVRVGTIDLRTRDGETVNAEKLIIHPEYSKKSEDFDVALIKLSKPLKLGSATVNKIELSTAPLNLPKGTAAIVTGFGYIGAENILSPRLKYAQVFVWTRDECNPQNVPGVTDHMICTGNPDGGVNSCQGDSGGPLTLDNKLYGVVSWGFGCAEMKKPAMYAYVGAYLNWIKKVAALVTQALSQISEPISLRVMGGDFARRGEYPYHAAIFLGSSYGCGGSIISETFVLTAAHCVYNRQPSQMYVRVGTIDLRTPVGQTVRAKEFILHPQYNRPTKDLDLALIRLSQPLKLGSATVNKIELSTAPMNLPKGTVGIITGFGRVGGDMEKSSRLKYARVFVWTRDQCTPQNVPGLTEHMVCTGNPAGGVNSCKGDSGGPLAVDNKLYGVISTGFGCAYKNEPALHAYVGAALDWIKQVAGV